MALDLIQPGGSLNPKNLSPLMGESYNLKLSQLIQTLLAEVGNESTQSCQFVQEFYELMQTRVDPPLESIWVYAALAFRSRFHSKDELLDRISAIKSLFQLISACSSSSGSAKCVALLAPVVYEVYKVAVELFGKDLNSKREKKVLKEVKALVEAVLGYVNVCYSKDLVEEGELDGSNSLSPFSDLVRIWLDSNVGLESFLPFVSGEVFQRLSEGGCELGYLAGVVVMEAFLLKLCLNFRIGSSRVDLEKELRTWAVGSITGFGHIYFFDTLVRMLLEKTLPLAFFSSSKDEVLLRKVLYDAVVLVDYSFLNPERTTYVPADRLKSLAMARLIVTHEAVEFFREQGDQRRSISYINAFSNSSLSSQIIRWIKNQIQVKENDSKSYGSSPKALIKWLMNLEDQGVRVFDDSILKSHVKLLRDTFRPDFQQLASKIESKKMDDDLLFYVDNKGEELDGDSDDENSNDAITAAFVAAAHSMKSKDYGGRKRKNERSAEKKSKIKFLKYESLQNSESPSGRSPVVSYDSASSGSEVDNPLSDDDTEQ
ncbi:SNF2 domain protein [Trema orientale]|uniref:SNF2 domain protein n=1 Tax=Trema orientale TaxID=63057 RepID=A0A2P5FS95_TREOI|nr:SNF2 domain protein [Trema orientale]